ncbi:hypothetical protein L2E82_33366 [Cichorium intybus]|uniref:Uncharacterized protein n=1 Tax=Cichorium intybus TaxID=13427 RepID=A0ACB9BK74_CICIN|nr:hypothetical protein L2E82_33366 [Cichorium intybus]
MYGRWEGELWFHRRHMWSVPSPSTPSLVAPINSSIFIDSNSFSKDSRKIHVGDCALFKPPHDSPPFVGIIRRLIVDKEDNLTLSVNWLYRPSDVKLLKGASLEAAPNEVFYSFHQDEIPAASLLHPCKVAFLRKGVELPSRVSSFVCRRVYDVETKRLWWLTDQDYINSFLTQERQQVVDKLLDKTRVEMYGSQSPKPLNSLNGTTQVKGKKREQSSDSDILKAEIAKITDKGGLVDSEGVEKIIQLMQPESGDKKVDLASRIMLVNVISVTNRFDLLNKFVQLRGLLILDEWLQEFHKGKIGDGSLKESDKDTSVEEFLFALLRALDRLPVNIHALQTCNVGKSVNHLRSHKNPEILKKARTLVDTWKKSVEAEMNLIERKRVQQMNIIETRSGTKRGGSWSNKSTTPEVSSPHMVKQVKISASQPSVAKHGKQSPESSSPTKVPAPAPAGVVSSDVPRVTTKEEKSSSSSSKGSPNRGTPDADNINNNKRIIVRLPNTVRSPVRTASGGSLDGKGDTSPANNVVASDVDTCQGKEGLVGSDDGEASKGGADSASGETLKSGKSYEASYSSINALVESCAKVNASVPAGDDVGMNLLASVAADVSPSCPPENKKLPEITCSEDNGDSRQGNAEVGPAPSLVSDVATIEKVEETQVNDESGSRSSSEKHEDEKEEDVDSEMLTSSCGHVSLEQKAEQSEEKANKDLDSSVLLEASENADKNEARDQEGDGSGPPDSTSTRVSVKLDFDLNEVVPSDDVERPASVTVAAAAKGPFLSSEDLLKGKKTEVGWKGSAATSAFRPAEPRKAREFLDFDLNVGVVDDVTQNNVRGGLDLNINASEETPDVGPGRPNIPQLPPRSLLSSGFDLNEENGGESIPHSRNGIQFLPNVPSVRMGNMDVGNFHSWFPTSSTYPAIPIPIPAQSYPIGLGAPSQRMLNPEMFKGPVLSSSPAVAFSSTMPFQFPGSPFETNFSIPSNTVSTALYGGSSGGPGPGALCFPTIPSQLALVVRMRHCLQD